MVTQHRSLYLHMKRVQLILSQNCQEPMMSEEDNLLKKLTLAEAAEAGDADAVQNLLNDGADVNELDKGSSALLLAAWKGHNKVIKLLLEKGANTEITDILGLSALHVTCLKGNREAAKMLLDHGCDPNGSGHPRTPPPIHFTVGSNEDIVLLLIEYGADVLKVHGSGDSPLMRAVTNGQVSWVKAMLTAATPDLSFTNQDSDNIFHCMFKSYTIRTASKNHCDMLEVLLNYAKQNAGQLDRAKEALTKAMPCLVRNGCMNCFKKALPFTDIKHMYDEQGTDILQIAMTSGTCWSTLAVEWTYHDTNELDDTRLEIVKQLLQAGASLRSTKDNVMGKLWSSPSTRRHPASSVAYIYYIRAWGGWYPGDADSDAAFQDFAYYLMDDAARLVCWAGYCPSQRDLADMTRTRIKQKAVAEKLFLTAPADHADDLVEELWRTFALNPRPLTNLTAICIRRHLCDNVLFKSKALHLPQRLQDHITLKIIADQTVTIDVPTHECMCSEELINQQEHRFGAHSSSDFSMQIIT